MNGATFPFSRNISTGHAEMPDLMMPGIEIW
jgi:hypothetical protein